MVTQVTINEVGPRDGLQSHGKTLTVDERLNMFRCLADSGIRHFEAGSFVSPKAVPQMAGTDEVVKRLRGRSELDLSVLVPNMKGYELAREAGARKVNLVLSSTETMNQKNIRKSLDETVATCEDVINRAIKDNLEAQVYVAVAFECPFEGLVDPSVVVSLAEKVLDAGATKIIIADTIGGANPTQVKNLLKMISPVLDSRALACHFHDTRGMALANILAALDQGVLEFDASVGGLGGCPFSPGATGNVATEDVVLMLNSMGMTTGIDLQKLCTAVLEVSRLTGVQLGGHSWRWLEKQFLSSENLSEALK